MKYLAFIFSVLVFNSYAVESARPELPDYIVESNELDENIGRKRSKYTFRITSNRSNSKKQITYSIDSKQYQVKLNLKNEFTITTDPGKHSFMFLLSTDFYEIIIDSLPIEPQHHMNVRLNFKASNRQITVKKPVIYLYPTEKTNVSVLVEPVGELTYTYPAYNNGWNVVAEATGQLFVNEKQLNYLFWEAKMNLSADPNYNKLVVGKENVEKTINDILEKFGLKDNEIADFVTYWVPEILNSDKENIHLQFLFNEECSSFAHLNIEPSPKEIGRIYMLWSPTDENANNYPLAFNIPSLTRSGFTVIEWGGARIELRNDLSLKD